MFLLYVNMKALDSCKGSHQSSYNVVAAQYEYSQCTRVSVVA